MPKTDLTNQYNQDLVSGPFSIQYAIINGNPPPVRHPSISAIVTLW